MESINHFSHSEHALILKKLGENEKFVCDGCQEPITEKDQSYYACEEEGEDEEEKEEEEKEVEERVGGGCGFYLHKKCADLPREINLPLIHEHPLTLFSSPPYNNSPCVCNICRSDWEWFTYHCSLCQFDIDVKCGFILQEGIKTNLQHEGHPHPLSFHLKPSLFHCDACNTNATKELSYFCTTCQFWIHKSCVDAPKSITVAHHEDPLLLSYSLPPQHRNFEQYCNICQDKVHPADWVYYCDNCRYFNHLKCATATATAGESEIIANEGDIESSQIMKLPLPNDESLDPLSLYLVNNIASRYFDEEAAIDDEIRHRLHDQHPLLIHNKEADITTNNLQEYNEILCGGCVRPISVPFYSCSECNFFLHRFCAELPQENIQCPLEPGHSIKVKMYEYCYDFFICSFCFRYSNGFVCKCASCDLQFDIGCAGNLIPSRIEQDSHQHPLVRALPAREGEKKLGCNACGYYCVSNSQIYSCKACNFNLCIRCVNYRGSVMHEYDRHSIPLTYPPIKNHPSDFICEICEEDINPRNWIYHCQHCNQSFHADCLSSYDWYSNVKFGGTVNIGDIHQHPLTFVRNSISENASLCDRCGVDNNGVPILECAPCGFILCLFCARQFEE